MTCWDAGPPVSDPDVGDWGYTFDVAGNGYTYGGSQPHAVAAAFGNTYSYDGAGNPSTCVLRTPLRAGITSYAGNSYTCGDSQPHAVTAAFGNSYGYDGVGNPSTCVLRTPLRTSMTGRVISSTTYILTYDAELVLSSAEGNRMTSVSGGSIWAAFVYDADACPECNRRSNRVKATIGSVTTLYPGTHFEYVNSTTYTRYYFAGADLVAFERSSGYGSGAGYGRRFVLRDHPSATLRTSLGSTSVIVNGQGNVIGQDLYQPYGDVRYQWRSGTTTLQTTYRYTSQRMEVGVAAPSPVSGLDRGLYYYNARWGACPEWNEGTPSLVRFIQPGTIMPNPGDSSSLNRYTYTRE